MEFNPGGLVRLVLALVGRNTARLFLFFFLFGASGLLLIGLASGATSLIDTWVSDARSVGLVLAVLVPLSVVVGFLALSAVSLGFMVYFARSISHGRAISELRRNLDGLTKRVERIEWVLGLDDSDSPFG